MAKPSAPPAPPGLPGQPGGLGDKIERTTERVLHWLTVHLVETISGWMAWGFELFMHALRPGMLAVFGPFLRFYRDLAGTPTEFKTLINDALTEDGEAAAALLGMVGTSVGGAAIGSVTSSLFAPITYAVNRKILPARADPATAIANAWRHNLDWPSVDFHTGDRGWELSYIQRLAETIRPRPDVMVMLTLWRRGKLPESTLDSELGARGYKPDDIARLKQATEIIPGPADLISMAVREAWRDDIAARWGYDADFPAEFAEWMQKQGDVDGWARKYWRAHWTLPGLTTVLEILHREDDFTLDDLDTFLRISDIPSAWRNYIKKVAYVPLTRVDTRRMYGLGVISRDEVKRNYLDLGYNDLNAERMTEFTIRYETDEDREATKTDILSFYAAGSLTAEEANAWLREIGYPDDLAHYLVARETTKAEQKRVNEQVKYIQDMYVHQEIDVASAKTQLGALGLAGGEINQLLDTWDIAREAKVERPSRATLDKLLKRDVISENDYTAGLDALGYQQKYIVWYLESVLLEKAEEARKEEEKVRTEQENVRKRKVKSDYQVDKASLDVDIAELQTAVAETQLALQERKSRYEEELRIATEALSVAQLEEQAAADLADLNTQIDSLREAILFLEEQVEGFQTEVAEIKLDQALEVPVYAPEAADRMIRERQVAIEQTQDDIASANVAIAELRGSLGARREKLREDINIVERIRSIEDIEADYRAALATMTLRLSTLRLNLTELREQKAVLTVEYRVGIAPPE